MNNRLFKDNIEDEVFETSQLLYREFLTKRKILKEDIKNLNLNKNNLLKLKKLYDKSLHILELLNRKFSESFIVQLEQLLTEALVTIFGKGYGAKILLEKRRGKGTAQVHIISPKHKEYVHPKLTHGFSIQEIIGVIFNILFLKLLTPLSLDCLMVDEGTPAVGEDKQAILSEFLCYLSKQLDIQLIFVTHSKMLTTKADKEIKIV